MQQKKPSNPIWYLVAAILYLIAMVLALIGAVRNSSPYSLLFSGALLVISVVYFIRYFKEQDGDKKD